MGYDTAQNGGKPHAIRLMNAVLNNEHKFTTFNYYNLKNTNYTSHVEKTNYN